MVTFISLLLRVIIALVAVSWVEWLYRVTDGSFVNVHIWLVIILSSVIALGYIIGGIEDSLKEL